MVKLTRLITPPLQLYSEHFGKCFQRFYLSSSFVIFPQTQSTEGLSLTRVHHLVPGAYIKVINTCLSLYDLSVDTGYEMG